MTDIKVTPLRQIYTGPKMKFLVLGRDEVETVAPEVPYIVISVTDPQVREADIADSTFRRAVLRLKFHDAGQHGPSQGEKRVMTNEDAQTLLAFVQEHREKVELIICQCEAGVSRSAGIAAALSRIIQGEDKFFFANYWPNRWVYRTLLLMSEQ